MKTKGGANMKSLKQLREEKKLSQDFIANKIGISKPHYCNIENGKRTLSYERACSIAKILGVKITDFFWQRSPQIENVS